jgi:hypothetical protein
MANRKRCVDPGLPRLAGLAPNAAVSHVTKVIRTRRRPRDFAPPLGCTGGTTPCWISPGGLHAGAAGKVPGLPRVGRDSGDAGPSRRDHGGRARRSAEVRASRQSRLQPVDQREIFFSPSPRLSSSRSPISGSAAARRTPPGFTTCRTPARAHLLEPALGCMTSAACGPRHLRCLPTFTDPCRPGAASCGNCAVARVDRGRQSRALPPSSGRNRRPPEIPDTDDAISGAESFRPPPVRLLTRPRAAV